MYVCIYVEADIFTKVTCRPLTITTSTTTTTTTTTTITFNSRPLTGYLSTSRPLPLDLSPVTSRPLTRYLSTSPLTSRPLTSHLLTSSLVTPRGGKDSSVSC